MSGEWYLLSTNEDTSRGSVNIAKTEYMLIGPKPVINTLELPHIFIENDHVERVHKIKILYVHIDESLTWEKHRWNNQKNLVCNQRNQKIKGFCRSRNISICI